MKQLQDGTYEVNEHGELVKHGASRGYYVALPGNEIKLPHHIYNSDYLSVAIAELLAHYAEASTQINMLVGIWSEGLYVYIDISQWVESRHDAALLGIQRDQLAIWDIENSKAINLTPDTNRELAVCTQMRQGQILKSEVV